VSARDALLRGPVAGGCGSDLCATRAWLALETPDDPAVIPPCGACAAAVAVALAAEQEDWLRAARSASDALGSGRW